MSGPFELDRSRALWNRDRLDLASDEVLAQILDRGEVEAWREIYRLAAGESPFARDLRRRILRLCREGAVSSPHLFLAAMAALGERVDPYPEVKAAEDREALA
ncbi:MAG TPA: hypothetical protein VFI25_17985 [Planctomycetota bacterium]|nr:hypothetical protein [Planctomycetota bacterium]